MTTNPRKQLLIGIIIILMTAVTIRFVVAPYISLEYRADTILFQVWGYNAYEHGLLNMYEETVKYGNHTFRSVNYLPPYLYILYGIEWLNRTFSPSNIVGTPLSSLFIKTPYIFFELATILLLAKIVFQQVGIKWALGLISIYAFHPAIIFITAGWGQLDSIYTFFLVLTVWFMTKKQLLWASVFWTIAFFFKMQSLAILPLLVYEIVRIASSSLIFKSVLTSITTAALLNLPFLLTGKIIGILRVIFTAPGSYPRLSINAFNFWWILSGGHGLVKSDRTLLFGLPLVMIGVALFFLAVTLALWFRSRVRSDDGLWITAAFLIFSFFMLPTEMHERYLFPFFAMLIPVLPFVVKARWLFGILSVTFIGNIFIAWNIIGMDDIVDPWWLWGYILAIVNTATFIVTAIWLIYRARNTAIINSSKITLLE